MASLKDLNITLPEGMYFTPSGQKALESQINAKVLRKDNPLYDDYYEETKKIALKLAKELNKVLNNIGKAPKPIIDTKSRLTISNPVQGDFHDNTGLLLASTGFMIMLDNVVVYKKNGRIHPKKIAKINKTALNTSLADVNESINSMSKKASNVVLWLDIILFSNADYSTSVNFGLGTPRWDGQNKQGTGWFNILENKFGETFRKVMEASLGLYTESGRKNVAYNTSTKKQSFKK